MRLTSEHWRQRADNMRSLVEGVRNAEARRSILTLAADYDAMAHRAEAEEIAKGLHLRKPVRLRLVASR
jgi:hypothetical protein